MRSMPSSLAAAKSASTSIRPLPALRQAPQYAYLVEIDPVVFARQRRRRPDPYRCRNVADHLTTMARHQEPRGAVSEAAANRLRERLVPGVEPIPSGTCDVEGVNLPLERHDGLEIVSLGSGDLDFQLRPPTHRRRQHWPPLTNYAASE